MNFDLERLWLRNLGRDDRATSDRSKEVRYPFLYSPLVRYIKTEVPFESLTDFTRPKGSGDKVVLRKIAEKLGLEYNLL
jgi:asparagine synthetase B (glutamine-hydrolysing)